MSNPFALTKKSFLALYHQNNDKDVDRLLGGSDYGREEGSDFLIVQTHDQLRGLQCVLNGYKGDTFLESVWRDQEIAVEIDKAAAELEEALLATPSHFGTHARLERRIRGLHNLVVYKRWMIENEIEEINFSDIELEVGFSDEYNKCAGSCNGCNEVVRVSADSYSWTAPLFIDLIGYVCNTCAIDFRQEMLDTHKNEQRSIPNCFNTSDIGLVKINNKKLENGFHYGMDDSPDPIIEKLNEHNIDVWFVIHPCQFSVSFDVYVEEDNEEKATEILDSTNTYQGFSTAGNLERGLRQASLQTEEIEGDGIRYSRINGKDGTATTRTVSRKDFNSRILF